MLYRVPEQMVNSLEEARWGLAWERLNLKTPLSSRRGLLDVAATRFLASSHGRRIA